MVFLLTLVINKDDTFAMQLVVKSTQKAWAVIKFMGLVGILFNNKRFVVN